MVIENDPFLKNFCVNLSAILLPLMLQYTSIYWKLMCYLLVFNSLGRGFISFVQINNQLGSAFNRLSMVDMEFIKVHIIGSSNSRQLLRAASMASRSASMLYFKFAGT